MCLMKNQVQTMCFPKNRLVSAIMNLCLRKDLKVWQPTGHGKSIIVQTVLPTIMQANNVLIYPSSQCRHMATQHFDQVT